MSIYRLATFPLKINRLFSECKSQIEWSFRPSVYFLFVLIHLFIHCYFVDLSFSWFKWDFLMKRERVKTQIDSPHCHFHFVLGSHIWNAWTFLRTMYEHCSTLYIILSKGTECLPLSLASLSFIWTELDIHWPTKPCRGVWTWCVCVCVCVCSEKKESVYVCGVQIFQSHRLNNKYWRDRVHTYTRSGLWMT